MSTEDLIKFARRCRRYESTHGELTVLKFPVHSGPTDRGVGREGTGLSYLDIARAFEELAELRGTQGPS